MFHRTLWRAALVAAAGVGYAGGALAQSATPTGSQADASDAVDAPRDRVKGYQIEMGVASSSISRGRPVYAGRYDASNQTTASVTLDRLGPGALTLSAWGAIALARFEAQPGTAIQIDLSAAYAWKLGEAVELGLGYLVSIFPRAAPGTLVDGAHEIVASLAYEGRFVTPKLTIAGDPVRQRGVYGAVSVERALEIAWLSLAPQVSLGVAAYEEVPLQINDLTASLSAQWAFKGPAYVALRGAFSYLCGPSSSMPEDQRTPRGRAVPWAMVAVGARK